MALIIVLLSTLFLILLATALMSTGIVEVHISDNYTNQTQALYIAQAGVEQAKQWLKDNMNDPQLMANLLVRSQNNPPDQSVLTRPDGTRVNTPLGTQTFGNGTYTAVIRDNIDETPNNPLVDTDRQFVITSTGVGPNGSSKIIQVNVASPVVTPSGALNANSQNAAPAFNAGSAGTGVRIPPTAVDGNPYDLNGNPLPPGSSGCAPIPSMATDTSQSTTQLIGALDKLRKDIVKRANNFCNADGSSIKGGCPNPPQPDAPTSQSGCCTPGLWWVRGTNSSYRYDDTNPNCVTSTANCYKNLDFTNPALHAVSASFATNIPTVVLPSPPDAPFGGAPGNAADPILTQAQQYQMQAQIDAIMAAVSATSPSQIAHITSGTLNGGTYTYGSLSNPAVVQVDATGGLKLQGGATMTGFGILVVTNNLEINASTLNWTGVVIVNPPTGGFRSTDGNGQINGALYLQAPTGTVNINTNDSSNLKITYSCAAVFMAMRALPLRTVSWLQLYQ